MLQGNLECIIQHLVLYVELKFSFLYFQMGNAGDAQQRMQDTFNCFKIKLT